VKAAPHDAEAEDGLIGCVLLDGAGALAKVLEAKITPECFYEDSRRNMWLGILWLHKRGLAIEPGLLVSELKRTKKLEGVGGLAGITGVTDKVPTTAQFNHYLERVRDLYVQRKLIENAQATMELAESGNGSVEDYVKATHDILAIKHATETLVTLPQATDAALAHAQRIIDGTEAPEDKGLAWPWRTWNDRFGAARGGELVIVAARPGMGKSSAARQCALTWIGEGDVLFFSREMPIGQLPNLFAQQMSGVSWRDFRRGVPMDMQREYMAALNEVKGFGKLHIFDRDRTLAQITARVRAYAQLKPIKAIIVDYLQRYDPQQEKGETRDTALGRMSMAFKDLAMDLNIPALVLAQIGRSMEREKRQPFLSDLRESGNLEQDADRVIFLWAPEKKPDGSTQDPFDGSVAELYVEALQAKGRGEGQDRTGMSFVRKTTTFRDITHTQHRDTLV
jgi:replicative DNA helicase